eukprot:c10014_g1_i1.p1 GENE.c10014_g1_i1~~c10014_g1_i1.p1  ORF type:complete len:1250 (+),score=337.09 c10014_g1_i1:139-3750(+)
MFVASAALPLFTVLFGNLMEGIFNPDLDKAGDEVQKVALTFIYIGLGMWVSISTGVIVWATLALRQTLVIRKTYIEAVLSQDMSWFDKNGVEVGSSLLKETGLVQEGLGLKFANALYFLGVFVGGIVAGFVRGWVLTLVILACMPVLGVTIFLATKLLQGKGPDAYAKAGALASEFLAAIRTIKAFSLHSHAETKYAELMQLAKKQKILKASRNGMTVGFMTFGLFCAYALALWFGSTLIANKETNPQSGEPWTGGNVMSTFFAVLIGGFSVGQAAPGLQSLGEAKTASKKIWAILDRFVPIDSRSTEGKRVSLTSDISFNDVKFSYASAPDVQVLKGLTFTVPAGKFVALVGPSGGGKSTTIGLLERFYDATSGRISIGGVDIKDANVRDMRNQIGLVEQEPFLFDVSVEDNIRMGKPGATQQEVIAAAKIANAHDFITALPEGYNTRVGEGGKKLSGGQKQRVAIARAMIRNPPLLLLDEATSALDTTSERLVQEAIQAAMQGRTVIAIAHRLSTVKHADKIVVIADGLVCEEGTHDELVAREGVYAKLAHSQVLHMETPRQNAAQEQDLLDEGADSAVSIYLKKASVEEVEVASEKEAEEEDPEKKALKEKAAKSNRKRLSKFMFQSPIALTSGTIAAVVNGFLMPGFSFIFTEMIKTYFKCTPIPCTFNATETCFDGTTDENACLDDLEEEASFFSCMFVVLAVGSFIVNFLMVYSFAVVGQKMTISLRKLVFNSLLHQDMGYFDDPLNGVGVLTSRLETDCDSINSVVSFSTAVNIQNVTTLCAGLALAFAYGWELALVLLGLFPLIAGAGYMQLKFATGGKQENKQSREDAAKVISEATLGMRTVTALNAQPVLLERINKYLEQPLPAAEKQALVGGIAFGVSFFMLFFMYGCSFSLGAYLIRKGIRSGNEILKVFFALAMAAMGAGQTSGLAPDASKFTEASIAVFETIDRKPVIDEKKSGKHVSVAGNINFDSVSFAYPTRPDTMVLNKFTASFRPGTRVAVVGPSGSGKSTIIRLLQRFYNPVNPAGVTIEGNILDSIDIPDLRSQIGLVEQEPVLFSGTISENIALGRPGASQIDIEKAARQANAHDFIVGLVDGYNTVIGPGFSQLSGGQKQRIAIARTLIRNPKLLLLDEATSALDSQSETIVNDVLRACSQGRTTIVIAHRLSTIQDADMILVLDHGTLVEMGTRNTNQK